MSGTRLTVMWLPFQPSPADSFNHSRRSVKTLLLQSTGFFFVFVTGDHCRQNKLISILLSSRTFFTSVTVVLIIAITDFFVFDSNVAELNIA
ncbi:Sensor histidine kinase TrcS [Dirofilaria immitis]